MLLVDFLFKSTRLLGRFAEIWIWAWYTRRKRTTTGFTQRTESNLSMIFGKPSPLLHSSTPRRKWERWLPVVAEVGGYLSVLTQDPLRGFKLLKDRKRDPVLDNSGGSYFWKRRLRRADKEVSVLFPVGCFVRCERLNVSLCVKMNCLCSRGRHTKSVTDKETTWALRLLKNPLFFFITQGCCNLLFLCKLYLHERIRLSESFVYSRPLKWLPRYCNSAFVAGEPRFKGCCRCCWLHISLGLIKTWCGILAHVASFLPFFFLPLAMPNKASLPHLLEIGGLRRSCRSASRHLRKMCDVCVLAWSRRFLSLTMKCMTSSALSPSSLFSLSPLFLSFSLLPVFFFVFGRCYVTLFRQPWRDCELLHRTRKTFPLSTSGHSCCVSLTVSIKSSLN